METSIPTDKFYGNQELRVRKSDISEGVEPFKCQSLLSGPTLTWKVFKKQADALEFTKRSGFGLMTFAFETGETRLFLVAHPEVLWHYDRQRPDDQRCSYEVIPEGSVCKLYLDLEYDKTLNPNKDDKLLLSSFVDLFVYFFLKIFDVHCDRSMIVILDSSTGVKFSFHVIFDIRYVCFLDNCRAGNFVKYICQEISFSTAQGKLTDALCGGPLDLKGLEQFFVKDSKGNTKLFCDECVYSKNHHFRLFKSTKKGEHSHLNVYKDCKFKFECEEDLLLASLVTYVDGSEETKILQYGEPNSSRCISNLQPGCERSNAVESTSSSGFPKVDDFIRSLIEPSGRIYRSIYFFTSNIIVYDIVGFRYCANIEREHKSNNVKYIVDLRSFRYYQKCHDLDCSGFKSRELLLPYEVLFWFSDDTNFVSCSDALGLFKIKKTNKVSDAVEDFALNPSCSQELISPHCSEPELKFSEFPTFGLPDECFSQIPDFMES